MATISYNNNGCNVSLANGIICSIFAFGLLCGALSEGEGLGLIIGLIFFIFLVLGAYYNFKSLKNKYIKYTKILDQHKEEKYYAQGSREKYFLGVAYYFYLAFSK